MTSTHTPPRELSLTPADVVGWLGRRGQLAAVARSIAADRAVTDAAAAAGLAVTDAELQQAANRFRLRHGLSSAEATRRWLAEQHLTPDEWERALEHDLLAVKFRDHLFAADGEVYFAAHRDRYARVRLRRVVAATDGLAREYLAQVTEDGRPFEELAAGRATAPAAGDLGEVFRGRVPAAVADAAFAAPVGEVVGPFPGPDGFELYQVLDRRPPELDPPTAAAVRDDLCGDWARERLDGVAVRVTGPDDR
jgi:peptidylprolyl isomerase